MKFTSVVILPLLKLICSGRTYSVKLLINNSDMYCHLTSCFCPKVLSTFYNSVTFPLIHVRDTLSYGGSFEIN
jgi:hypothetical protein